MRIPAWFAMLALATIFTVHPVYGQHIIGGCCQSAAPQGMVNDCPMEMDSCRRCCRPCLRCLCCGGQSGDCDCRCHGSYKYPVPSQYTYFWPGIYSQQTMTQYVSPWRYPDLNPVPESWKLDPTDDKSPYSGYRY